MSDFLSVGPKELSLLSRVSLAVGCGTGEVSQLWVRLSMVFFSVWNARTWRMHEHTVFVLQKGAHVLISKENDMKVQNFEREKSSYGGYKETMQFSFIFETKTMAIQSLIIDKSIENLAWRKLTQWLVTSSNERSRSCPAQHEMRSTFFHRCTEIGYYDCWTCSHLQPLALFPCPKSHLFPEKITRALK